MKNRPEKKEVYSGIDVCKAIAAILIVILHAIETTDYFASEIKFVFTRFAVPFFFIASGFFFCKGLNKAEEPKKYFYQYEKNILKIFLIWGIIIYGPFTVVPYIQNNSTVGVFKIIGLLVRRMVVIGSGPYWYLVALFWSTIFIYLCHVKKKDWLLGAGIIGGLLLQVSYACFRGVLSEMVIFAWFFKAIYVIYSWEFNFIMYGIPFVGIGYLICKKNIRFNPKISALVFVCSTLIRIVEYRLPTYFPNLTFWENNEITIGFIIQAIAYFNLAKELDFEISKEKSLILRQWSSCVYFSHVIVLYNILNPLLGKFTTWPIYAPEFIAVKVIIVISICTAFFLMIRKTKNQRLKILING